MSSLLLFTFVTLCSLGLGKSENATQGCHMAKLDLVILVDSSASVGYVNFKQIVKFILDLVNPLPVHSEGIRVALVRYSSTAHVISYLGDDINKLEKSAVLGGMRYMPGSTRTDLGIALTRDEVLIPERGDRPDVPDQVILLTDGESTNKVATREETLLLKKRPYLKIIVVGNGDRLDDKELLEIATSLELKHVVTNFSYLSGMLKDLESATCEDRTKRVTQAPVSDVPERDAVNQLKNANSQTSGDNKYLLRPSSSSQESSHPSEPSLMRQFHTTNSSVESYPIPLSGVHKMFSHDFFYPSGNATQRCHMAKMDLVIIVDSSASVGSGNFKQIVKFILDLVKLLPVHSEGIRVALVRYSSDAHVISYLGDDMNKLEKSATLGRMKYTPGSTRTDLGIALTRDEVLIPERGDRPDVPDQIILLTDGESTIKIATREETRLLKKRPGRKIIVIGIGDGPDNKELLEIATSPELKHVVTSFSHLSGMLNGLESATCEDRTKSVTLAPVTEVSTPPERETVVQLKNANSQPSVDDNYLLRPSSSNQESSHPSEPSLIRQFETTNSNVESYSIPLSRVYETSSGDFIYPSSTLPDMTSSLAGTPSFHLDTSDSSASSSSMFYKLNDRLSTSEIIEENIFIFDISSQSEIQLQATTTRLVDDQTSVLSIEPEEIQLSPTNVLPLNPPSSDVLNTVPDFDIVTSSFTANTLPSAPTNPDFDAVDSLETMTTSSPTPPLTPLLLSLLAPSSDALLKSSTSSSSFLLSKVTASSSLSITPISTMPFSLEHSNSYSLSLSPAISSSDLSISRKCSTSIMLTLIIGCKGSQSHIFNTGNTKCNLLNDHGVYVNININ